MMTSRKIKPNQYYTFFLFLFLAAFAIQAKAQQEASDKRLYNGPIDAANTIVTRDVLRYGTEGHPYLR